MSGSDTRKKNAPVAYSRSVRARYPDRWPAEMRADVVAAFLDFETTGQLWKAITRGEAPRPTCFRVRNGRRESMWALDICRNFIAQRHDFNNNITADEDIRSLL